MENISNTNEPEKTTGSRTLRTCLILSAGCAGLLAVSFCILFLLGVPIARTFFKNVDWDQGEALLEVITGDLQATLGASMGEGVDQELLLELEGTLEAVLPTEQGRDSSAALPDVIFEGVQFSYPQGSDYGALPANLPADLEVEWFSQPERIVFSLSSYPLLGTFHEPRIIVMSTQALLAVNGGLEPTIDELKEVLEARPRNLERVPFIMPGFNAAQIITTQIAYLDFEGGKGVRFVTQYGQAAWPINNTDLFYAYQGLTDDGAYLITAVLPVTHPSLPADGESAIGEDYETFFDNYEGYLAATKGALDSYAPDAFNPMLQDLDEMMSSFRVESP